MNAADLKPADFYAKASGVKAIIYGPPGSAKTPISNTCPRPVLLSTETGLLSMKGSRMPTYQANSVKDIEGFFAWLFNSNETKQFDTVCVDSISQTADIYLAEAKRTIKHGLQQYGDMAEKTLVHLRKLNAMPEKHMYLIAKEDLATINNLQMKRPFYPGKELPREISHLYDCIFHLAKVPIPQVGEHLAFRCIGSYDVMARNRVGTLNEFEPPDFSAIVSKCMV